MMGKGFTAWTNVTKVKPRFKEHYHPHIPADLGFTICDWKKRELHRLNWLKNIVFMDLKINKKSSRGGVLVIVVPKKESNFDHKRGIVKFSHLLEDYNNSIDEHDLTHLEEILKLYDLSMDIPAGTKEQFEERSLKNYENRCLYHHVFDLEVLEQMCRYFNLTPILMREKDSNYIIVAQIRCK